MQNRDLKLMLLGIARLLFGGFILADPSSNLPFGIEFWLMLVGLLLCIVGFSQRT
jgi:hypothetical protein